MEPLSKENLSRILTEYNSESDIYLVIWEKNYDNFEYSCFLSSRNYAPDYDFTDIDCYEHIFTSDVQEMAEFINVVLSFLKTWPQAEGKTFHFTLHTDVLILLPHLNYPEFNELGLLRMQYLFCLKENIENNRGCFLLFSFTIIDSDREEHVFKFIIPDFFCYENNLLQTKHLIHLQLDYLKRCDFFYLSTILVQEQFYDFFRSNKIIYFKRNLFSSENTLQFNLYWLLPLGLTGGQDPWATFLRQGLYDPRLFNLIFAF